MLTRNHNYAIAADLWFKSQSLYVENVVVFTGEEGLEPPTDYLEGSCSIQLSYSPTLAPYPNILRQQLQQCQVSNL
jgi:hypothetical protein